MKKIAVFANGGIRAAMAVVVTLSLIVPLTMCTKAEFEEPDGQWGEENAEGTETGEVLPEFQLTINSINDLELKTGMEPSGTSGIYSPVWMAGDKMQIYIDEVSASAGHKYTLENQTAGATASFTGSVGTTEGLKTVYGFYPASALVPGTESSSALTSGTKSGSALVPGSESGSVVSVDVPYFQSPSLTSFDPACDILAAKPMQVNFSAGAGATINDARFARQLAILKITPADATSGTVLSTDKVLSVKVTAETVLTGRARLDLEQSKIIEWTSQSARNYVKAEYMADKNFNIDGSDAALLMVAPGTLASGSTLNFEICTDKHLITKSVTLPKDVVLTAGNITPLKLNIRTADIQESGASLPFNEDFTDIKTGNSTATDGSNTPWTGNANFPDVLKAYQAGGAVRLGTGSATGSIATKPLNLANSFTVSFKVKGWTSVEGNVLVSAGTQSKTVSYTSTMSGSFETVSVPFYGESSICEVSIATTNGRCFIDDVTITNGKAAEHEIVAVDQMAIPATEGATATFTVASDYAWTASSTGGSSGFTFTPSSGAAGKIVTVTVTATSANPTSANRNLGGISIGDGTVEKTVTVLQTGGLAGWPELPAKASDAGLELCKHSQLPSNHSLRNYSFLFDKTRHCALWVAWPLHSCYIGSAARTNSFGYDPDFIDNYNEANIEFGAYWPYHGSTYSHSRGHQMPSAERTLSTEDNNTTFYATNMTPQLQDFNGGVWEELESLERNSFICSDTLYIVTGPYFDPGATASYAYDNKGNGKACQVPTHYWKIFLRTKSGHTGKKVSDCSASELQCVAFWFTHEARSGKPTAADMKSVRDIETLTGFTFFPNVPNAPKTTYSASDWGL